MPADASKPTGIVVMDGWYAKVAESMIGSLWVAVASDRTVRLDESSMQVLSLGKSAFQLLSSKTPCLRSTN
jgi:hypothetical protein